MVKDRKSEVLSDELKIFLSHKHKDWELARAIKDEIERNGAGRLRIFLSEKITPSRDWSEEISRELTDSHWLCLLYTDPTPAWDWCLFEAGYFAGKKAGKKDKRKLTCLLSAELEPPEPLKKWQAVKAVPEDWKDFLKEIYGGTYRAGVRPINSLLAADDHQLLDLAMKIVPLLGRKPSVKHYNNYLYLFFDYKQVETLSRTGEIPGGVRLESDSESLKLFGLLAKEAGSWTYQEFLKNRHSPEENGWTRALGIELKNAANDRDFNPCLPLFEASRLMKSYHPVIYRRDRMPDASLMFKIIFIERLPEEDPQPTGNLRAISVLMTVGTKFRWGIIAKYYNELSKLFSEGASGEEMAECLARLRLAILKIESEGAHLGFYDRAALVQAFNPGDRGKVKQMIEDWAPMRKELTDKTKARDAEGVKKVLEKLREMNKNFLVFAVKRYAELLQEIQ